MTPPAPGAGRQMPLLPLKNVVIFPNMIVPLYVGREKSIRALEEAMLGDRRIFLAAQKDMDVEDPAEEDVHQVGIVGELMQMLKLPDGTLKVLVEGQHRARIQRFVDRDECLRVESQELPETHDDSLATEALVRQVADLFDRYVELHRKVSPEAALAANGVDDPGRLADIVGANLVTGLAEKQEILETLDQGQRLERIATILQKELDILEIERDIRRRVRRQIDQGQREFYLKEQMRAIQEELGVKDEHWLELDDLRDQVRASAMPEPVKERMLKEVDRLDRTPASSPEVSVLRNYLDLALALPWEARTEDSGDIDLAQRVLDEDHYGLHKAKDRILEFLAVRQLAARPRGPVLCFVGPPGVGKTSLGKSVARALGRRFVRLSLGGVRDEAEIRGHRRTYVGAMPGRILQSMRYAGSRNPVFLLDEIDKMSADFRGDPAAALLEVLDPEQNSAFSDHYLEVPFDLSEVLFITTANVLYPVPRALQDRLEVISLPGYTHDEKVEIGRRFLVPRQIADHGIPPGRLEIPGEAVAALVTDYTREAGVRNLEKQVAAICRKTARQVVAGRSRKLVVSPGKLTGLLGPARFRGESHHLENAVGMANGLAWTDAGGLVLPIEVLTMPGKGRLTLTGQLGEVMRESAQAALSYARANGGRLSIAADISDRLDVHVHVPEGAIPKDGPSAGLAMALALISALAGRPVRSDVAMTGEITLRGRILPVGGIREKMLAAHRLGIRRVVLPEANRPDLAEIQEKVRRQMEPVFVSHVDEVLALALEPAAQPARARSRRRPIPAPDTDPLLVN
ncbi:MAG: endopeptidase La [Candidatus Dormibacteria bacterium]